MTKRYRVTLTGTERERLQELSRFRTALVRTVQRVQALLLAADDKTAEVIAEQFRMGGATLGASASAVRGEGAGGIAARVAPAGCPAETGPEVAGVRGGDGVHEAARGPRVTSNGPP